MATITLNETAQAMYNECLSRSYQITEADCVKGSGRFNTYAGWQANQRQVMKGQKAIKVPWNNRTLSAFHISQTIRKCCADQLRKKQPRCCPEDPWEFAGAGAKPAKSTPVATNIELGDAQ